jgi:hypothetical protein
VVRLSALRTGRLYSPGNIPGTHFCYRLSRPQGHSATGRIISMKNSNNTIGNRTRDLPACSAVQLRHRGHQLSPGTHFHWGFNRNPFPITFCCLLQDAALGSFSFSMSQCVYVARVLAAPCRWRKGGHIVPVRPAENRVVMLRIVIDSDLSFCCYQCLLIVVYAVFFFPKAKYKQGSKTYTYCVNWPCISGRGTCVRYFVMKLAKAAYFGSGMA